MIVTILRNFCIVEIQSILKHEKTEIIIIFTCFDYCA